MNITLSSFSIYLDSAAYYTNNTRNMYLTLWRPSQRLYIMIYAFWN